MLLIVLRGIPAFAFCIVHYTRATGTFDLSDLLSTAAAAAAPTDRQCGTDNRGSAPVPVPAPAKRHLK